VSSVPQPVSRIAPPPPNPADEPVNILLVDDQPENLLALAAILEPLGQHLLTAASGRDALRTLLTTDAAVILLDVKMPEMDGFETALLIRDRERSRNTPILFLTAAAPSQAMAHRGYAAGAVDYLVKPAVPEFVRSKVAVFVELAKAARLLERQAELLRAREHEARELAEARAAALAELEQKNRELEAFSYAVSHDLRAPLRRIDSFGRALLESRPDQLDETGQRFLQRIREATGHMAELIDGMLHLARVTRAELRAWPVDLSGLAAETVAELRQAEPDRDVEVTIRPGMVVNGDPRILRILLQNLLGNAWKFTAGRAPARIELGLHSAHSEPVYYIRDNGVGFDMAYAGRLFTPFQRLHAADAFPGTGIGLATSQRIVQRHGGRIWLEGDVGLGATVFFTLGHPRSPA
jgi:two-component system sensor histidine kinase/response regulator